MTIQFLREIQKELSLISDLSFSYNAFVGLDGYVDFIQRAVKFQSKDGPVYFETLKDYGEHIVKAAGKSAQIELVTYEKKLGGNAPIMAQALGSLGFKTTCIGNFGKDSIQDVFQETDDNVTLISIGEPAVTNALEFHDGKLILSEVGPFKNQDWKFLKSAVGLNNLFHPMNKAKLIALVDWCNLPYATEYWRGILVEVLPELSEKERHFFFDIADPSRRSDAELEEVLEVIEGYNSFGKVTLGLNENETEKLYASLLRNNGMVEGQPISLIDMGQYIFRNINVWNLLIHPTNRSISINNNGISELHGRLVSKPKISTGGGDNFNAGYCAGLLLGFDIESSMILGMAASGSYVQNGMSNTLQEIESYINNWIHELKA